METPAGYRLVRVGIRGRVPYIENTPEDQLTEKQKKGLIYRKKMDDERKAYAKEYYRKNKEKILNQLREQRATK